MHAVNYRSWDQRWISVVQMCEHQWMKMTSYLKEIDYFFQSNEIFWHECVWKTHVSGLSLPCIEIKKLKSRVWIFAWKIVADKCGIKYANIFNKNLLHVKKKNGEYEYEMHWCKFSDYENVLM